MRVNISSCLVLFVLGCNVSAAIKHEIVEEKQSVTLPCPHPVEGDVTWSRETNGSRVDILTTVGDTDKKHIPDPGKRYSSPADKSLHIHRVTISDSGRYLCNNESAVDLTVIPSGTTRLFAKVSTSVVLKCPSDFTGSNDSKWIRHKRGTHITVYPQNNEEHRTRIHYSAENKTLTITQVQRDDAGLYYCDEKPAAYLDVKEEEQPDTDRAAVLVPAVLLPLLLIIVIVFLTWRCSIKGRGGGGEEMVEVVYAEPSAVSAFESAQDGSNQQPEYCVLQDLPAPRSMMATPRHNVTVYSQINK